MKILLTTHQFLPKYSAGTEILAYSVARELIKRGHTVRILTGYPAAASLSDDKRFEEFEFDLIHIYCFHHSYTPMGGQVSMIEIGYNNRLGADYFDRIVENFQPDLVHFFHLDRLGTGLIERSVEAGLPCFMTITDFWSICPTGQLVLPNGHLCSGPSSFSGNCVKHFIEITQHGVLKKLISLLPISMVDTIVSATQSGFLPSYPNECEVIALSERLTTNISRLNKIKAIIVPSNFMKDFLIRFGVRSHLIKKIEYGIDTSSILYDNKLRKKTEHLRVGYIGTLAPHKGCHVLIDAFKKLKDSTATLKIYGNPNDFPDYTNELKLQATENPLIAFCGTFPNSEIGEILTNIDVLVIPSVWYENIPLVLLSARAAHCPVVASNLPGLAEVIQNEENGLLFEPGNSIDLSKQLLRFINDKSLISRFASFSTPPTSIENYTGELLKVWNENSDTPNIN